MSNENKIRILYVQPGKYPEEQFIANGLHPLQRLVGGYMQAVWKKSKSAFCPTVNSTPFVRQYDILSNKWGVLLCQKEYQTNDIRRSSRKWL